MAGLEVATVNLIFCRRFWHSPPASKTPKAPLLDSYSLTVAIFFKDVATYSDIWLNLITVRNALASHESLAWTFVKNPFYEGKNTAAIKTLHRTS